MIFGYQYDIFHIIQILYTIDCNEYILHIKLTDILLKHNAKWYDAYFINQRLKGKWLVMFRPILISCLMWDARLIGLRAESNNTLREWIVKWAEKQETLKI